jgi:hypothetical protein
LLLFVVVLLFVCRLLVAVICCCSCLVLSALHFVRSGRGLTHCFSSSLNVSYPYSFVAGFGDGIYRSGSSYADYSNVYLAVNTQTSGLPFSSLTFSSASATGNPSRYHGGGAFLTSHQRILLFDG